MPRSETQLLTGQGSDYLKNAMMAVTDEADTAAKLVTTSLSDLLAQKGKRLTEAEIVAF